jgi:predicted nucleic acid-binding protein
MKDKIFIDTNIWIYLFDSNNHHKQEASQKFIEAHFNNIVLSTQVLNELYNVLSKKLKLNHQKIKDIIIKIVANFDISPITTIEVFKAIEIKEKFGYSYWDSLILASAIENNCGVLVSEDMQHKFRIESDLQIINPFSSQ